MGKKLFIFTLFVVTVFTVLYFLSQPDSTV